MRRVAGRQNLNTREWWDKFYATAKIRIERRLETYVHVEKLIPKDAVSLLEVGCGLGYGAAYIKKFRPELQITATDFSIDTVALAVRYPGITFEVLDITACAIEGCHDVIIILETLEHLEEPRKIIAHLLDHCKILILAVPNGTWKKEESHIIVFNEESFNMYPVLSLEKIRQDKNLCVVIKGNK